MRWSPLIILILALSVSAQSGRVKPPETTGPVVKPSPKPSGAYNPTDQKKTTADPAETPTPTPTPSDEVIRVDSTLVPIPVSVVDRDGRPVMTLKLEDFELRIDGRPVEIGDLSRSETPLRLAMLFDNSGSVLSAREFEVKAAVRFFERVVRPERDLAALFSVATASRLEQGLTNDIASLTRAIQSFPPPIGATALLDGIVKGSLYLGEVQGRRVIVIVSDGDDTYSDATLAQAVRALQVANCQVYVVKTTEFENFKRTGSRRGNANVRQLAAERRMLEIAAQTGGKVYSPIDEDELDEAFRQIASELSQQYVLSYYPDPEKESTGQFREITLSVKAKPGYSVRTRKGYYVPRRF